MNRALRALRVVVLVLSALLLAAGVVLAQGGSTAQISGTVKDESGGVLPGADVAATQTDTGATRTVVTDANGGGAVLDVPRRCPPLQVGDVRVRRGPPPPPVLPGAVAAG